MESGRLGREIPTREIARLYRSKFGVDVSAFFLGPSTSLLRNERIGFYQFTNVRAGDEAFYRQLMNACGYDEEDKREFQKAASLISPEESVLDVGCGQGRFSIYCGPAKYKGIDLNSSAVQAGQELGRSVFCEEISSQPAQSFDVVTLFQVLEHVPDPQQFISQAVRCIRPNGRLIVSVPDQDGPVGSAVNQILNYPPHHLTWWSESSLRCLFAAAPLRIEEVWREPLQKDQFKAFLYSMLHPRRDNHFERSARAVAMSILASVIWRLMPADRREIPYATGQALLVVGRKGEGEPRTN